MSPKHTDWFRKVSPSLVSSCGKEIQIFNFEHLPDDQALSEWATRFRNHYCLDSDIDLLRGGRSRAEYLRDIKFPSTHSNLGPAVRAGDFAEILVADFLEWILGFWVPRMRWRNKVVRDESPKGCDIVGFRIELDGLTSPRDTLLACETKAALATKGAQSLQSAIKDSVKDRLRLDESLNYVKQQLIDKNRGAEAAKIERFQSPADKPYRLQYGAAAVYSTHTFEDALVSASSTTNLDLVSPPEPPRLHPARSDLVLFVFKGDDLMTLANMLYERAANEA